MAKQRLFIPGILLILMSLGTTAQVADYQEEVFWEIGVGGSITWDLTSEQRLPHSDNIEMGGRKVAGIIHYSIDKDKRLEVTRHIIYPQLRVFIGTEESHWKKYRAYLKKDYSDDVLPTLVLGEELFIPGPVDSVLIDGVLSFYHAPTSGLALQRSLYPSMTERLFVEAWTLTNTVDSTLELTVGKAAFEYNQMGIYGRYRRTVDTDAPSKISLEAGESITFGIRFSAYLNDEPDIVSSVRDVLHQRLTFINDNREYLILETPDPVINQLFYFSKIRAAESIYTTPMGLVHSPGGGRYYAGVWANDQAEYSGPFFPYLGLDAGNEAALNAYRVFLNNIPEGDGHFWSSFEMNGALTCCGADRGDAAMIAFGASHFALARGDKEIGQELWPLIEWSLDYCDRQKNEAGVITSDSDEMEGRIATGNANLSTSSLYYGALLLAADLAEALDLPASEGKAYRKQAMELGRAIEAYFGATIEGLETYRYFEGHEFLRHWICLPLVVGINDRKEGTLEALFSRLWTNNGVRVEYNPNQSEPDLFWDRGTLYAFRGAFKAGGADLGLQRLHAYSQTRLLGFHVPYVVEAWPEGNMAHLSAESALYCRIFTEGLLGITPTGFRSFDLAPNLPEAWDFLNLRSIHAFGKKFDVKISRHGKKLQVEVLQEGGKTIRKALKNGEQVRVNL